MSREARGLLSAEGYSRVHGQTKRVYGVRSSTRDRARDTIPEYDRHCRREDGFGAGWCALIRASTAGVDRLGYGCLFKKTDVFGMTCA